MQVDHPLLLEREAALADLRGLIDLLKAGPQSGRCVLVEGEPGMGKTSLLRAARRATEGDAEWWWGSCEPLLAPSALAPWFDMLSQLPPTLAEAVRRGQSGAALFADLLSLMQENRRPLVLVIEDVQWADGATLDLLRFLGRRISTTRALLVLSWRASDVGGTHPLRSVFAGLDPTTTLRLTPAPLSRAAVAKLASHCGRSDNGLYAATQGNPFFVTELLAAPQEGGASLPAAIRDALLARFARLTEAAREVLATVSVSPTALESGVLQAVCAPEPAALLEVLDSGMLQSAEGTLRFSHELTRLAVVSTLGPRAPLLHAALFHALSQGPCALARLVHHAEHAGLAEAVAQLAPRAAAQAAAASAHRQAASLYGLALERATSLPAARRVELLEARADECMLANEIDVAITARQQARTIRRDSNDPRGEGINLRMLARLEWLQRGPAPAIAYAQAALPLLECAGDERELALGYATLAHLQLLGPSPRNALEMGRRALRLAESAGDPQALAFALSTLAAAELRRRDDPQAWSQLQRSLAMALEHGLEEIAARTYSALPSLGLVHHRAHDVLRWCAEALAYGDAHDLLLYDARLRIRRAYAWLDLGDWTDAAAEAARLTALPTLTALEREQSLHVQMLLALRRGDGPAQASAYWRELVEGTRSLSVDPWYAPQAIARVEAAWLAGDHAGAARIAAEALAVAVDDELPWSTGQLAVWLARLGELPAGFSAPVAPPCAAELAGHFEAAAAAWAALGCRYEQALALMGAGPAGLRASLEVLDALGAEPAARIVRRRMRALGERGVPRGPYAQTRNDPRGLTRREREVLVLLAQGRTNAAIAEHLHRSERTVENHVAALLAKLGARDRHEAARLSGLAEPQIQVSLDPNPGAATLGRVQGPG